MTYDKDKVLCSFERWANVLETYHMPEWENLPAFDLYMDQVIVIMNQYMEIFNIANDKDMVVTSSMISSLKHTLSISDIQKIIPTPLPEDEVRKIYGVFAKNIRTAFHDTQELIIKKYFPKIKKSDVSEECMGEFILQSSIFSSALHVLAEKAIVLGYPSETDEEKK